MLFGRKKERIIVLGIDGVPYTFLEEKLEEGKLPNIKKIIDNNTGLKRYNSVYPTVSSVAWTSYMTGENPGEHSIFGFVDRNKSPFSLKIPLAGDRTAESLWKKLSDEGKKVLVMNVPVTYPPENVNGILISGFLTPTIEKVVKPDSMVRYLKDKNYVIDVDPHLGHSDKNQFMDKLHESLDTRMEIFLDLLKKEHYDLAQCHIMETDRINHFFWGNFEDEGEFGRRFDAFYEKLDGWIGKTYDMLTEKDKFLVLSDHGFCRVKYNVQLNHFLEEEGYLTYEKDDPQNVMDMSESSKAYSLIPGRVFINLEGREGKGSVPADEYDSLREELKERILDLKDPEGKPIIEEVFYREDIYSGPYLENAADLIAHPMWGYDIKGHVNTGKLCHKPEAIDGMHTYDDAAIFGAGINIDEMESIQDPLKNILKEQ